MFHEPKTISGRSCSVVSDSLRPHGLYVAHQASLFIGFSRQEYWSELPCPLPGDLPDPEIRPVSLVSPALAGRFFTTSATWEAPTQASSVQSLSHVWLFLTPWTVAHQASLSITNSQSLIRLMSIKTVMPSNHLILCHPLLLLPSVCPNIRDFSSESVLCSRLLKYWSISFGISPSNEYAGLISFRIDWFDLLAVQGTLKRLLQHHSSKASVLRHSAFFIVQVSHPYITTGKTKTLTRWTFVGNVTGQVDPRWLSFYCWCSPFGRGYSRRKLNFLSFLSRAAAVFVSPGLNLAVYLWILNKNMYFSVTYTLLQLSFSTESQAAIFMLPGVWLSFRLTYGNLNNTLYLSNFQYFKYGHAFDLAKDQCTVVPFVNKIDIRRLSGDKM